MPGPTVSGSPGGGKKPTSKVGPLKGILGGLYKEGLEQGMFISPYARVLERPAERLFGTNIENPEETKQRITRTFGRSPRQGIAETLAAPGVSLLPGAYTASQAVKGKLGEHPILEVADVLPALGAGTRVGRKVLGMGAKAVPTAVTKAVAEQPPVVQKLLDALQASKPIRAEQQALYTAERSKRLAQSVEAGTGTPGEAGFFARKAPLSGELPKAKFEPLRLEQPEVDELFDMVGRNTRLTNWQVVQAQTGLHKLIRGGTVPQHSQLELLSRVFGSDLVNQIATKGVTRPAAGKITALAGLTRGLMTFLDFSAPLRQGLAATTRHPILAAKAFTPMIRSALSKNAYKTVVDEITKRPTFEAMQRGKVALTGLSDYGLSREEAFAAAQLAERLPGVGRVISGSNRAYTAFLTRLRADVFDSILKGGPKSLKQMTTDDLTALGSFVNTVTGRGELGKLAPAANLLTTTIFAPRLIASRLSLINPRWYYKAAQNPVLRKEALTQAAALYGSILTTLALAKAAGAKVTTDWRSSDFGKIVVPAKGGAKEATVRIIPAVFGVGTQTFDSPQGSATRFEVTGGLSPYIRLIGQLYHGEALSASTGKPQTVRGRQISRGELLQRFVETKFSPVASAIRDIAYEDMRPEDYNVVDQVVSRTTPMILQDWYELTQGGQETLGEAVDRLLKGGGGAEVAAGGPRLVSEAR